MKSRRKLWLGLLLTGITAVALGGGLWLSASPKAPASSQRALPAVDRVKVDGHGRIDEHHRKGHDKQPGDAPREAEGAREPHPITPMHEAMAERREVIGALVGALEHQEYGKARKLLDEADELARRTPESSNFGVTVHGYRLILDCLAARAESAGGSQEVSAQLLQASRRYLDEQRLPPRREVRRVCLEGRPFARRA